MRKDLIEKLAEVERISARTKWARLRHAPAKYALAIGYRHLLYPISGKEWRRSARTFFGREMLVGLPAGTDIYLTGGKTHASEIRLARLLVERLRPGDHFLDIGAHFGYFSLLAAELVGDTGLVRSFEPSGPTYALLTENIRGLGQVRAEPLAIAAEDGPLVFYEFPPLFSEYNSTDVAQFESEDWFKENPPKRKEVPATSLDTLTAPGDFRPDWIKIDAEGGEWSVVSGGKLFLEKNAPGIVMEYLEPSRNNAPHRAAVQLLAEWGYRPHTIGASGDLLASEDLDAHLMREGLDSDNVVFLKTDV
jgi:FkbM family methyltransferase